MVGFTSASTLPVIDLSITISPSEENSSKFIPDSWEYADVTVWSLTSRSRYVENKKVADTNVANVWRIPKPGEY